MAVAVPFILQAAFAYMVGIVASKLLGKREKPEIDGKKISLASRGAYLPILIGRREVQGNFLWWGDRTTATEGHAGGKGVTGGGGSQLVYRESAFVGLALGPGRKLHRIRESGKVIWQASDLGDSYEEGITAETHPSGSTITVSGHGSFRIYWGERDQPTNGFLNDTDANGDPRLGYAGKHPFLMYILWIQKRLGGATIWPQLDYEIEIHPYKVGDTFIYTGSYDGTHGLPERLSDSVGWFKNGLGAEGDPNDIALAQDDPTNGIIKLVGSHIPSSSASHVQIVGNSALADGRYQLLSIVYNASETLRSPSGVFLENPGGNAYFDDWTMGGGITSIVSSPDTIPPQSVPASFDPNEVHRVNTSTGYFGLKDISWTVNGSASDQRFSPGINHIRLWVRGFAIGNFTTFVVRLEGYDHPTDADTTHSLLFTSIAGIVSTTPSNGAYGSMEFVGQDGTSGGSSFDWWEINFNYRSGTGTNPADDNWKRRIVLLFENNGESSIHLYANHYQDVNMFFIHIREAALLADDDGTLHTGITTVTLGEPLVGSDTERGTLAFLAPGSGHDGANIAHTIDQLMFEPHPHGCGLPRAKFDMPALEAVGVQLGEDNEGLRTHVLIEDGGTLEDALGRIMLDIGLQIPWDPVQGKYTFKLVRDPQTDPVAFIPKEMVHAPLPQIATILDAAIEDRKIYMFKDRDGNYRDAPGPSIDDDGKASREERQNSQKENLFIVTDYDAAAQVVSRREQYEINPPTSYEIFVGRAARRLVPGIPLEVEGIPERLRLMEVGPIQQTSTKIKIKCLTDIYTAPPPATE